MQKWRKWMLPVGLAAASLAPVLGFGATGALAASTPPAALVQPLTRAAEPVLPICPLATAVQGIDINQGSLRAIQTDLGKNFVPLICDVTIWKEVAHTFQQLPPVDVLVNCAGITGKTDLRSDETDPADVERVFRVNFFGSYHTSKAILPRMAKRGYGRLLHIASIAGKEGNAGMFAYSASKAAVIAMTKVQGKEMAGTGVTVNAVLPGPTRSEGVVGFFAKLAQDAGTSEAEMEKEFIAKHRPTSLIRRLATVEEVANMVVFVCSPQASATTGAALRVDGGVVDTIA